MHLDAYTPSSAKLRWVPKPQACGRGQLPLPHRSAAAVHQRTLCSAGRIGPQAPAVVPKKKMVSTPAESNAAVYAGSTMFSAVAPKPSSLPMPAFFLWRAESEATQGLLRIGELA